MAQDTLVVSPDEVTKVEPSAPPASAPSSSPATGDQPLVVSPDDVTAVPMTFAIVNGQRVRVPAATRSRDPRVRQMDPTKQKAHIAPNPGGDEKGEALLRGVRAMPSNLGMMAGAAWGAEYGGAAGLAAGSVVPGAGNLVLGATGAFLGGIAGGMIGAYSGESLEVTLEALWQKFRPGSGMNLTPSGAVNRIGEAGTGAMLAEGAVGPAAGAATKAVVGRVAKGFSSKAQPWAQEAIDTFKRPGGPETGSAVTPAEVSKSRILNYFQRWVEGSIFADMFGDMSPVAERQAMAESKVLQVLDDLGPTQSAETIGRDVQGALPPEPVATAERNLEVAEARHETQTEARETAAKAARTARDEAAAAERTRLEQEAAAEHARLEQEAATATTTREQAAATAKETRERTAAEAQAAREQRGATARQTAESQAKGVAEKTAPATPPSKAGAFLQAVRERILAAFRSDERQAWKAFEDATEAIPIATPRLDGFVESLSSERAGQILPDAGTTAAGKIGQLEGTKPVTNLQGREVIVSGGKTFAGTGQVSKGVRKVMEQLSGEPGKEPLTVAQFQQTLRDLNRLQRGLEKSAKTDPGKYNAQLGLVKKLNQLAHEDLLEVLGQMSSLEQDGTASPGSPLALYRSASQLTRLGNEQLFNKQVMEVVRSAPEKVADKLAVANNSTAIRLVTQAVGDANMGPVRRVVLDEVLKPDPVTGQLKWPDVVKRLANLGDETLTALFPQGEHGALQQIARGVMDTEASLAAESAAAAAGLKAEQKAAADALAAETKAAAERLRADTSTVEERLKEATRTAAERLKAAHTAAADTLEAQTKASKGAVTAAKAEVAAAKRIPDPVKAVRTIEPTAVAEELFNKKNLGAIRAVKRAVGPDGFAPLQRDAMNSLVIRDQTTKNVDWVATRNAISKVDDEVLQEYFPNGHADQIRQMADLMVNLARRGQQSVPMGIQMGQYGFILGLLKFKLTAAAPAIVLTPPTIARIYANPTALRWLTMGVQAKPWSVVARQAAAELTQFLYQAHADATEDQRKRTAAVTQQTR